MNKREIKKIYNMDEDQQAIFICNHKKKKDQKESKIKKLIKKIKEL